MNPGSRLFCLADHRKKPLFQLHRGNPPFIPVIIHVSVKADLYLKVFREGVYHRGAHAVESAAGLVNRIVKFSAGVKGGKDQTLRRHSFFMHPNGNPPPVVIHRSGPIRLQGNLNPVAEARQMFVHRVVHDLINQMIQTLPGHAPDIHAGPLADSLQSFQYGYTAGVIGSIIWHVHSSFLRNCYHFFTAAQSVRGPASQHYNSRVTKIASPCEILHS